MSHQQQVLKEKVLQNRNNHHSIPEHVKQEREEKQKLFAQSHNKGYTKKLKKEYHKILFNTFGTKRPTAGIVQKHFNHES